MRKLIVMIVVLLTLTACDYQERVNPITQVNKLTPGIGQLIVFPTGWELHSFTVKESWSSGSNIPVKQEYVFICKKVLSIPVEYRFCTPMIEQPEGYE